MFACIHSRMPLTKTGAAALLECASIFSPRVEDTAPGTAILDLEGLERLFGSLDEIANRIFAEAQSRNIHASVGIAANPDAAMHAARGWPGISVLANGTESERLSNLPLDVLCASPEILETLERWGVRTFGAFAKLPAKQIAERLGQHGLYLHQLARGAASRPLVPRPDAPHFGETMELEHTIDSLEPMTFILTRLLDVVCMRLRTRGLATFEIRLDLELEHCGGTFSRVLRLPIPVANPKLLVKLFILDLESHPPGAAIVKVSVEAHPSKPRVIQNGLYAPLAPEPEKLELTLARIASVVGEENVGSPEILNTHRPDAFRMRHFHIPLLKKEGWRREARARQGEASSKAPAPPTTAIRLFRPPREATVELRGGSPVWVAFPNVHGPISMASGPWRTSGDWWASENWDREEWDIQVERAAFRIFRDVKTGRWFAEGVYD
jgi:protein ImuB